MSQPRIGEFNTAINGLFEFEPSDFATGASYFGLHLSDTYIMAHLRDAGGRQVHVVRPMAAETSPGVSLSSEGEDGVYSDPRGAQFLRGGFLHRHLDGAELALDGLGGIWSGGAAQSYRIRAGERCIWRDSDNLDLEGKLLGPGTQLYIPWRENGASGGTLHTGLFYEVTGTLFGEPVSGFLMLDHIFSPAGHTLHGSPFRRRLLGAWNAFATRLDDGAVQYGQLGYGAGPFRYANIVDDGRHICCPVTGVRPQYDAKGLAVRLDYSLANGEVWEWVADPRGALRTMIAGAAAQGSTCQVHKGHVTRAGDTRPRASWYSIIEWFPERIVDDPSSDELALPPGL